MKINKKKPWLDTENNALSDEQIREQSGEWSLSTWERFSKTFEGSLKEDYLDRPQISEYLSNEDHAQFYAEIISSQSRPSLSRTFSHCMKLLHPTQREILRLSFWEEMTTRDIATELNLSKSAVARQRTSALARLRLGLIKVTEPNRKEKKL